MAQFVNIFDVDLQRPTAPLPLQQMVGEGDSNGLYIGARVYSGGDPVDLQGTCVGKVVRADGATVPLTGSISGNLASVVLDQASCAVEGPLQVALCWVSGTNITTLLLVYGSVVHTQTGNAIQPSTPIPDLTQLLAEIENMRTATAAANAAAANALGNFAGLFNDYTPYFAGDYVTYTDGYFYRFKVDHAAGAWDSTQVDRVTAGSELTGFNDLRKAISQGPGMLDNNLLRTAIWEENVYYDQWGRHPLDGWLATNILPVTGGARLYYSREGFYYCFTQNGVIISGGVTVVAYGYLDIPAAADGVIISKMRATYKLEEIYMDNLVIGKPFMGINPLYNFRGTQGEVSGTLTDMNDAVSGMLYTMGSGDTISQIGHAPSHVPSISLEFFLITVENQILPAFGMAYPNNVRKVQILFSCDGAYVYYRYYQQQVWYDWVARPKTNQRTVISVKPDGSGDFTKFTDALASAYAAGNTDVYIYPGTYNILSEINPETAGTGPVIGNGTRLYFYTGAEIVCEYTGGNSSVESTFSPINAGSGDFEIHNMVLRCKNTRYCVHDDLWGAAQPYYHLYKDCTMTHDVTGSSWLAYQCIGGGFGMHGVVEIDGGYYEAPVTLPATRTDAAEITYHQPVEAGTSGAKNTLVVRNVYFKNTTVRAICGGPTTEISDFIISGCSCVWEPSVYFDPNDPYITYNNWRMRKWNNEIRA